MIKTLIGQLKTLRNNQNKTTLKNDELLLINCKMNNNGKNTKRHK